ncbi:MAG: DsbC family protein [Betaproteobacteria bacterium]|nr:DsbC family protein [Betaproteobacteria bacterium]
MKRVMVFAAVIALLGAALPALADEADVKRAFEARHPGVKVEKVTKTPYGGLYEIFVQGDVVYTDEKAEYLFIGRVIDARTRIDLTERRLDELTAVKWSDLPLDQAVKTVRGNGKRIMAVFSDPHCPACRQLDTALQEVTDATIYTFLFPVIHPELRKHSEAIWCSKDPSQAYFDLALRRKVPEASANCPTPIDKNLALGQKLRVNSTPTLFFKDGRRVRGWRNAEQLSAILDETSR